MTTSDLFDCIPRKRHRSKQRVMMHVVDAGDRIAIFQCTKCKHETDWTVFRTVSEAKRGIPCVRCNQECP